MLNAKYEWPPAAHGCPQLPRGLLKNVKKPPHPAIHSVCGGVPSCRAPSPKDRCMAAFPLSSCFRRTACFPLLSGIVLPAQTQSSRGHIFHFTLYMRLRYISTPFLPLFPFFEAPQEMPVLPEKSSFFLLSASFCLYLTGQAVLPAFGIFKISRSIFGIYTISFFCRFPDRLPQKALPFSRIDLHSL